MPNEDLTERRKYHARYAAKHRIKKQSAGLCIWGKCEESAIGAQYCIQHLERVNTYAKQYAARRYMNPTYRMAKLAKRRAYLATIVEHQREYRTKYWQRLRAKCFEGRYCVCCGENNPVFLTIDHINGDGNHRRRTGKRLHQGNTTLYARLVKYGWPSDLQVLCYNCNCAKKQNAYCPHEDELRTVLRVA